MVAPDTLVDLALEDPAAARTAAARVLDVDDPDPSAAAHALRAVGVAQRVDGDLERAATTLGRAIEHAERAGDRRARGLCRSSLASVALHAGDVDEARRLLDLAADDTSGADRAEVDLQRGAMAARAGDRTPALAALGAALRRARRHGRADLAADALANRGLLHGYGGDLGRARRDLEGAKALFEQLGAGDAAASMEHNLGWLAAEAGDLVAAFEHFGRADHALAHRAYLLHGVHDLDWATVALAAGLAGEAHRRAARAARAFARAGSELDAAEARLVEARAALATGDLGAAEQAAAACVSRFADTGRPGWALEGRLVLASARARLAPGDVDHLGAIDRLAGDAADAGLLDVRDAAHLVAVESLIASGRDDEASRRLAEVPRRRGRSELSTARASASVRLRSGSRDVSGEVRDLHADAATTARRLGSVEVHAGLEDRLAELRQPVLRRAVARDDVAAFLEFVEWGQLAQLDRPPARPAPDRRGVELRSRLAAAQRAVQDARRELDPDPRPVADLGRAESAYADHVRTERRAHRPLAPVGIDDLRAALGTTTAVVLADVDGTTHRLVVSRRGAELATVGPTAELIDASHDLLDALARLGRGSSSNRVLAAAERRAARATAVLDPVVDGIGGPMVVIDAVDVVVAPGALASRSGAATMRLPSASQWVGLRRRRPRGRGLCAVAGPDLPGARAEVDTIGAIHDGGVVLSGDEATRAATSSALSGARIAHLCAHTTPRPENPLFSAVQLADGDLVGHDLRALRPAPDVVVLASCRGAVSTRLGTEWIGLPTVLVEAGSRSVIASVVELPDDDGTTSLVSTLHRHLADGRRPAEALARTAASASGALRWRAASLVDVGVR